MLWKTNLQILNRKAYMELSVENNKDESNCSLYSILCSEKDGIKIVEINERGCNYHDFVLIYYKAAAENIPLLKQLHEKYKKSEKTICFIGCKSYESDSQQDYSEYYSFFDLNGIMFGGEKEFESIVLSAYSCRGGQSHGDPQDWLNLKNSGGLCCLEETGKSVPEIVNNLYGKLGEFYTTHPYITKIKTGIVCVLTNGFDDIPMSDIKSISKLSEFFEEGHSLDLYFNTECEAIEPGSIKLTLISDVDFV